MSAIKCRQRQQVDNAQVDTQKGNKGNQRQHALFRHLTGHLRHTDRTGHLSRSLTGNNLVQTIQHGNDNIFGIDAALFNRAEKAKADLVELGADAD